VLSATVQSITEVAMHRAYAFLMCRSLPRPFDFAPLAPTPHPLHGVLSRV
jgi:hypothetical protein